MPRTGVITHLIAALAHRLDVWKAREDLMRMDDRMLADIGIHRAEINRVVDRAHAVRPRMPGPAQRPVTIRGVVPQP